MGHTISRRTISQGLVAALLLVAAMTAGGGSAHALLPGEAMDDPALDARARALYAQVRCVQCQNQSIADSNADIAADMRAVIRARLESGASDQEILDYLVSRYGRYVLLSPAFESDTLILWLAPAVLFGGGIVGFAIWYGRARRKGESIEDDQPLSDNEEQSLAALMSDDRKMVQR